MKKAVIFFITLLAAFSVVAQQGTSTNTVTITVDGNKSLQVAVDGKDYSFFSGVGAGNKSIITINNLEMGQHTLLFTRADQNMNRSGRIATSFNLRQRFDMLIKLNGNGSLELIEKIKSGNPNPDNQVPMSTTDFNNLLRNVKNQRSTNGRRTVIINAFKVTNNNFTAYQVSQLLQQVNSEKYRLELAKLSYPSVTDRNNFNQLYTLFNSQASKNELEDYVNSYEEEESDTNVAMSDAGFTSLLQTIKQQWPASTQLISLTNAFNNTNNYFTTYQARQLIQLTGTENNRLQLAKLSYRTITDRVNFSQLYNLFNSQASKNDLADYVNRYNEADGFTIAMSDTNFTSLYQSIQQQWPHDAQMNSLSSAFNNTGNYFTTYQASRLIQIVNAENNRLMLAKLSYRSITDRANFSQIYNLVSSQAGKDELTAYVNNYYTGGNTNPAMSDAGFATFYQTLQGQYFPGEQMTSLTNAFNTGGYYFSTAQVKQLIPLVSVESNRLQLAKLSYRTVTDRSNFSQLYDILNSQYSRDELDAYVKSYKE